MHMPVWNFTKSSSSPLETNILSSSICKTALLVQRRQEYYEYRLFNVPVDVRCEYLYWHCIVCERDCFHISSGSLPTRRWLYCHFRKLSWPRTSPPVLPKRLFCRNGFDVVPIFLLLLVYLKLLSSCTPFQSNKFRNSRRYTCTAACWRLLSSVGNCLVQDVANAGQVPGTRSGKCRKFIGSVSKSRHWRRTSRATEEHCLSPLLDV